MACLGGWVGGWVGRWVGELLSFFTMGDRKIEEIEAVHMRGCRLWVGGSSRRKKRRRRRTNMGGWVGGTYQGD